MISASIYNSLEQVAANVTPDAGLTRFIYRTDGQIRFSQNSKQRASNVDPALQNFSYTSYDAFRNDCRKNQADS